MVKYRNCNIWSHMFLVRSKMWVRFVMDTQGWSQLVLYFCMHCVCLCAVTRHIHAYATVDMWKSEDNMTTYKSRVSPSTTCVPETELKSWGWATGTVTQWGTSRAQDFLHTAGRWQWTEAWVRYTLQMTWEQTCRMAREGTPHSPL